MGDSGEDHTGKNRLAGTRKRLYCDARLHHTDMSLLVEVQGNRYDHILKSKTNKIEMTNFEKHLMWFN